MEKVRKTSGNWTNYLVEQKTFFLKEITCFLQ